MRRFFFRWFSTTAAVLVAAYVLPGIVITGPWAALIAALFLGLVNTFVRPIFILLTLPLTFVTLGLFLLIINALMLRLVAFFVDGFFIVSTFSALIGSIIISVVSTLINGMIKRD